MRELLSHTAGFTDYPPGTSWSYSNLGYLTLGILIHRVSGQFYGDFLQQRIFRPLGMSTTRVISEADIIANRSAGYRLVNGAVKNQEWVSSSLNTTAAGSRYFSVLDLARWDAALYTEAILKKTSLAQMWTVATLRDGKPNSGHYGYGWFIESPDGHRVVEHEGQWRGFETQISRYVDDELTVVVLTNLADAKPDRIAHGVAGVGQPLSRKDTRERRAWILLGVVLGHAGIVWTFPGSGEFLLHQNRSGPPIRRDVPGIAKLANLQGQAPAPDAAIELAAQLFQQLNPPVQFPPPLHGQSPPVPGGRRTAVR